MTLKVKKSIQSVLIWCFLNSKLYLGFLCDKDISSLWKQFFQRGHEKGCSKEAANTMQVMKI